MDDKFYSRGTTPLAQSKQHKYPFCNDQDEYPQMWTNVVLHLAQWKGLLLFSLHVLQGTTCLMDH